MSQYFTGLWTDHSDGKTYYTLSGPWAAALQAAIPIWVTFVGSSVWNIFRIALYHWYMKGDARDTFQGYRDQRRVLLRNSGGGLETTSDLLHLSWCWRYWKHRWTRQMQTQTQQPWQPFPITEPHYPIAWIAICVAVGQFIAWTVAGVLVGWAWTAPYVSTIGQLAVSPRCGFSLLTNASNEATEIKFRTININASIAADQYVKQCYVDSPGVTAPCSYFPTRRLSFTAENASCPFVIAQSCLEDVSTPFVLDTGPIDSNNDLGINAVREDRVTFRKRTTCSPITSQGFANITNVTSTKIWPPETQLYRFYFGKINGRYSSPWTFQFPSFKPLDGYAYDLNVVEWFAGNGTYESWSPVTDFWDTSRTDADLSMFFLNADHVEYEYPTTDPMFVTGRRFCLDKFDPPVCQYVPAYDNNVLACVDQYMLCPATDSKLCSPWSGIVQLGQAIFDLALTPAQLATAKRLVFPQAALSTSAAADGRGGQALLASLSVLGVLQSKMLPPTQWRLEVSHWFQMSLAKLQQQIIDFAAGPTADPSLYDFTVTPFDHDLDLASQCSAQKIMLPQGISNFSWLAIQIVLGVGISLWVLGFFAENIADAVLSRLGKADRRRYYALDSPLQLQRLAYKAADYGEWPDPEHSIPVWHTFHDGKDPELPAMNFEAPNAIQTDEPMLKIRKPALQAANPAAPPAAQSGTSNNSQPNTPVSPASPLGAPHVVRPPTLGNSPSTNLTHAIPLTPLPGPVPISTSNAAPPPGPGTSAPAATPASMPPPNAASMPAPTALTSSSTPNHNSAMTTPAADSAPTPTASAPQSTSPHNSSATTPTVVSVPTPSTPAPQSTLPPSSGTSAATAMPASTPSPNPASVSAPSASAPQSTPPHSLGTTTPAAGSVPTQTASPSQSVSSHGTS